MSLSGNMQTLVAGGNILTQQQRTVYEMVLIKHLLPFLDFVNDGQRGTVPRNSGGFATNNIQWRKRNAITLTSAHTTALTEGVPPDFTDVTWGTVTTQLAQYGAALKHSDVIAHAGIDDNIAQFAQALGELAGLVINTLVTNCLVGGTNVQFAAGRASRVAITTADIVNSTELKKAVRTLRTANVPTFADGFYHAYLHVYQAYDLAADTDWKAVNGLGYYPGQGNAETGINQAMGVLHGVKVMKPVNNTGLKVTGGGTDATPDADVYLALIMGPDSFGVRDFEAWKTPKIDQESGLGIKIYFVPADTATKDDPIGQFGTMGYKFAFVAKILDGTRFIRLETGATA